MNTHSIPRTAIPALLIALTACGGEGGTASAIRIDTLQNGAVAVHNPEQGLWTETNAWRAVEDLRLGQADGEGPDVFAGLRALEVDAYGRIYALDAGAHEVRVFNPDGTHLRTFGRKGAGPGEMEQAAGMTMGPDGTVWVADPANVRFTVWDTAGALRTTVPRREGLFSVPWPGRFDRQGRLWDVALGPGGIEAGPGLLRMDPAAGTSVRLPLPAYREARFEIKEENRQMFASVPYAPRLSWTVDGDGRVWSGVSDRYRLALHEPGGDTLRVVERAAPPVPVSRVERDSLPGQLKWFTDQGGEADLSRVPDHKPAFESIHLDDQGWLWVRPSLPASETRTALDVFDPEGRYQGRVTLPVRHMPGMPLIIRGAHVYAVVLDEDEVQHVVRMRVEGRPPRT